MKNLDVMYSSKSDEWATPQNFFDDINAEFNFNLDAAADDNNHKCEKYYTVEQNGLEQKCGGYRVFCNLKACGAELGHDLENESVREDILNMPSVTPKRKSGLHWIERFDNEDIIKALPSVTPTNPSGDDCVSRQAVIDTVENTIAKYIPTFIGRYEKIPLELARAIEEVPPVTPTRKVGKWIKVTETEFGIGYQCSECGRFILTESIDGRKLKDFPYCHCGADMRGDEDGK